MSDGAGNWGPTKPEQLVEEAVEQQATYWGLSVEEVQMREEEQSATSQNGMVSEQARRAYAAEALRQKDHVSAGLFAIFLGVFGIHKFYLGYNQAGFVMLAVSIIGGFLTFGLAAALVWMLAVIEGVIYLTRSQTEFDQIYVLNAREWF